MHRPIEPGLDTATFGGGLGRQPSAPESRIGTSEPRFCGQSGARCGRSAVLGNAGSGILLVMEPQRDPTVFVHAMGRGGSNAWPKQVGVDFGRSVEFITRRGWEDLELPEAFTFDGEAEWLASQLAMPTHVVGHSWSGVVALELALRRHDLVSSLLLCEPALLGVAVDHPSVREHFAHMRPAYEPGLTVEEFGLRFSAAGEQTKTHLCGRRSVATTGSV
jgi:pimeloyl-ACP methyl ester carboxylesterase